MPWTSSSHRTGPYCWLGSVRAGERGDADEVRVGPGLAQVGPEAVDPHLDRAVRRGERRADRSGCRAPGSRAAAVGSTTQKKRPLSKSRSRSCRSWAWLVVWPDRVDPLGDLAALLGRGQGLDLDLARPRTAALTPKLLAGIAAVMNRERARLERDGADLDPADDLVLQALVVDLDVVVGVEVAVVVVVHVEVDPPAEEAGGPQVDVVVEPGRLEAAAAAGVGVEEQDGAAALVPGPVGPELEPDLAVDPQVGVLACRGRARLASGRPGASSAAWARRRLAVEQEQALAATQVARAESSAGGGRGRIPGRGPQTRRNAGRAEPGRREGGRGAQSCERRIETDPEFRLRRLAPLVVSAPWPSNNCGRRRRQTRATTARATLEDWTH